jgi:hypothetical protein
MDMIQHRLFASFNSVMFDADRAPQRVAVGLVLASLIMAPSMPGIPVVTLSAAIALLLPRRAG